MEQMPGHAPGICISASVGKGRSGIFAAASNLAEHSARDRVGFFAPN